MKVVVAGDFCPQQRASSLIEKGLYEESLSEIRRITSESDYAIVNFECPICDGSEKPISKQGPNLSCNEKGIEAVKWCGFTAVTLANNHILDYVSKGISNTIRQCDEYGVDYVGAGLNLADASKVLIKTITGEKLAVINCCEHEFSIATDFSGGANPLNPIKQYYAIQEARNNADYVLIIVHGGHEHYQLPSPRMVETYHFFIDAGADAVVNHHQHCYSGFEWYQGKPIFYGLGNFFFDQGKPDEDTPWNYGYCVQLVFSEKEVTYLLYPYEQCKKEPKITFLGGNAFEDKLKELNKIISDKEMLAKATQEYYNRSMSSVEYFLNPYQNRIIRGLVRLGLIQSPFKKKWLIKLKNYICCESHKDKVEHYLSNKID